jgi:hypothetical protein
MKVMQSWTEDLPLMQQSVIIAAVRGPDGIRKDHVAKLLLRWLRRCFLISAFDKIALIHPGSPGGGSFTGPSLEPITALYDDSDTLIWHQEMDKLLNRYLSTVDELPHHFQLHFMHAAEILGYKHPNQHIREWWNRTYLRIVNDLHLLPEPLSCMDTRLGDREETWRAAEEVVAYPPQSACDLHE